MVEDRHMANQEEEDLSEGSDTSSDDDLNEEQLQHVFEAKTALDANPTSYDHHIKYIDALSATSLKERLRAARQQMQSLFPLSEQLWLEWIQDEIEDVEDPNYVDRITALFKLAVQDYLSIPVWHSYLGFLRDMDPEVQGHSSEGASLFRSLCEEALTAGGLHVADGVKLWNVYRGFELSLEAGGEGGKGQVERVRSVFQRQLQVPLMGNEEVMEEYRKWEEGHQQEVPPHVQKGYEKAQQAVDLRSSHETAVKEGTAADANLLAAYLAYVKLEQTVGDPARVQVIFERAIAVFPVTVELWYQYTRYLEAELRIPGVAAAVYQRAVRNCPWVGALWGRALNAVERSGGEGMEEAHQQLYSKGVQAGLQGYEDYLDIICARIDCLRRQACAHPEAKGQLRAVFREGMELLSSYFPGHWDPAVRLPAYWAHCEAQVMGDGEAAVAVWEDVVKGPWGRYFESWSLFASMLRNLRKISEARTVYKRAYGRKLEAAGQLAIANEWLRFEREEGSAEDYLAASLKVEPILKEAAAAAVTSANPPAVAAARAAADRTPKLSREEIRQLRRANDPNFKEKSGGSTPNKRTRDTDQANDDEATVKRSRTDAFQPSISQLPGPPPVDQLKPPCDVDMSEAPTERHPRQEAHASSGSQDKQWFSDENTVFVKNLSFSVREDQVEQLFKPSGGLVGVRLVRDPQGRPKGFGYVQFQTREGMLAAVQLNGTTFMGRELFVAESAPPGKGGRGGGHGGGRGGGRGGFQSAPAGGRGQPGRGEQDRAPGGRKGANQPTVTPHYPDRPKAHLQLLGVPRAVAHQGGGSTSGGAAGAGEAPKSNSDFRKMFLGGGKRGD